MPRKKQPENKIFHSLDTTLKQTVSKPDLIPLFKPLTKGQHEYVQSIDRNIITFVRAPAGAGKTAVACAKALEYLRLGKVERIVVTRPALESGQKLGYTPGTLQEKFSHFVTPLAEEFDKFSSQSEIKLFKSQNKIQYIPTAYLRGHNLHNAFVISDESASFTYTELLLILTRIGDNSKLIICADVRQSDLKEWERGAFEKIVSKLDGMQNVGVINLHRADIVRNTIIGEILDRLMT